MVDEVSALYLFRSGLLVVFHDAVVHALNATLTLKLVLSFFKT